MLPLPVGGSRFLANSIDETANNTFWRAKGATLRPLLFASRNWRFAKIQLTWMRRKGMIVASGIGSGP